MYDKRKYLVLVDYFSNKRLSRFIISFRIDDA